MFVEWNDAFSVQIDLIDGHHRKLIDLLNKSYLLIMQEAGQEQLSHLLDELVEYARYHFAAEEELMKQHHYHDLEKHVIQHFSFINKVLSLKKDLNGGKTYISIEVFDFIKDWLLHHILNVDNEMGREIRQKMPA